MNESSTPKPKPRLRIRLLDRAAEAIKRRDAEQAAARAQKPVKDLVGYDPYGRTRHTGRYAPGERGRIDPPALGGDKIQPKNPFGGGGRRRG